MRLVSARPLIVVAEPKEMNDLDSINVGTAFTKLLHETRGAEFKEEPLGNYVDVIAESIDPRSPQHRDLEFEYVNLRQVDEVYGDVLSARRVKGRDIGSNKHRFRSGDILFAKIMPSLANKKIAVVPPGVASGLASTEFIVLRPKTEVDVDPYYLFRALRSDHFIQQAVANVSGATGRQRVNPRRLLELRIIVLPREIQTRIGDVVEEEFALRRLAAAKSMVADEMCEEVLPGVAFMNR